MDVENVAAVRVHSVSLSCYQKNIFTTKDKTITFYYWNPWRRENEKFIVISVSDLAVNRGQA